MKQKKPFLLILWAIMLCMTLFMLSSCLDLDDEDKTLVNVSLENVPTEAIDLGKFDEQTEVYLKLEYDDNSVTRERITQAFFGENNKHYFEEVGTHEFEIMYRGFTIVFSITFKMPVKYYTVEFVNALDTVVSEQTVEEGKSATSPTEEEMFVEGWRFLGTYDKSFAEVEEDLTVKGEYVKTWNVSFYNNNNELIKSYIVDDKAASPEPTEEERAVEGYTFLSWDRTFDKITKNRTVYGIYQKVKESTSDEYFTFTYLSETDSYEINAKDVNNMPAEVVLPSTHEGKPVTSIGGRAFSWCSSLTSIEIPSSVTSIGYGAFSGCHSLTRIDIPSSVTSIGFQAFLSCSSLTRIDIPSSVTSIGIGAFEDCGSLTSITVDVNNQNYKSIDGNLYSKDGKTLIQYAIGKTVTSFSIPDGVTSIGDWAFVYCSRLTSVTFGENSRLTSIGEWAFRDCSSLTSMEIPSSVTSIGNEAFSSCSSLTSITVDVNNQNYKSIDGNLYSKDGKTLIQYAIGKTATSFLIPDGVTSIGYGAFYDCSSLTSVTFGENSQLTSIGERAFYNCGKLTSIEIPSSVTSIGNYAFSSCSSLTSIEIPSSVTSIGDMAFPGCSKLTSITVDVNNQNYKSIDGNLYSKDGKTLIQYAIGKTATSFSIPDGVTSIGGSALYYCSSLTSIEIPSSVTSIGSYAFEACSSLTKVYYGGNVEEWAKISISWSNEKLTEATRYYYSEEKPTEEGNYWHYDENGNVVEWG